MISSSRLQVRNSLTASSPALLRPLARNFHFLRRPTLRLVSGAAWPSLREMGLGEHFLLTCGEIQVSECFGLAALHLLPAAQRCVLA